MNNKEVKSAVNNKLKLYRNARIGEVAMGLGLLSLSFGASYLVGNRLIDTSLTNYRKFLYYVCSLGGISLIAGIIFGKSVSLDKNLDIKVLKALKKELKHGINKFEEVESQDFEKEFAIYKKKILENKVK